ncbi:MAG: ELWxxDGT repeat protein [Crocinitomicaceae bacterium]|jgi:ELWxxDGT repeat protein
MIKKLLLFGYLSLVSLTSIAQVAILAEEINAGTDGSNPVGLTEMGGNLYFSAYEPIAGTELRKYDGVNPTTLVADINPSGQSNPKYLTVYNGKLYFQADDGTNGAELWEYDGTNPPTLLEINPGAGQSNPSHLTVYNGKLYFAAYDGPANGIELWVYDGTTISLAADINPGGNSSPSDMIVYNSNLYFTASDGTNGSELWEYNGTTASMVANINPTGASIADFKAVYGGRLYFRANNGSDGLELWRYDGLTVNMVQDINTGPGDSDPSHMAEFNGDLYFYATDGVVGNELWSYDGVSASLIQDINPAGQSSSPQQFIEFRGKLYFQANDGSNGRELWEFDGTTATLTSDINPTGESIPSNFMSYDGSLYFNASNGGWNTELWKIAVNDSLIITEINYNGPESGVDSTEYIELYNAGATPINLNGYTFAMGVTYTFGNSTINAGDYFVIAVDSVATGIIHGTNADAQWISGSLSNGGESIVLKDNFGNLIDSLRYDDTAPWPTSADGYGPSIRLCDPFSDNELGANWSASTELVSGQVINFQQVYGSPGSAGSCVVCNTPAVPVITASVNPLCAGESTTIDWSGTSPGDATNWHIYTGGCGTTPVATLPIGTTTYTTSALLSSTSFYIRGEDGTGCIDESTGGCGSILITVYPLPIVSFTAPADLCLNAGVQTGLGGGSPTGGIYSGPGVTDDANGMTYSIDPLVAGTGFHTFNYSFTDGNGCSANTDDNIEVLGIDDASFSYATGPFCPNASNETPTITGVTPGTFTASPAGLVFANTTTGEIDIASSTLAAYTITYTTSGVCPNTSNTSFAIEDNIPPVAVCQDITLFLDGSGFAAITDSDIDGGSFDNCGSLMLIADQTVFSCSDLPGKNVILNVYDSEGNSDLCISAIFLIDSISPIASCQDITVFLDGAGTASIAAADINNGSTDNCTTITLGASQTMFTCSDVGPNTVVLTVTDASGNTATCTSTVTVSDTISPTASCQDLTIFLNGSGNASIVAGDIDNGSSDNCSTVTLAADITAFTCAEVGPNTVVLTVTDASGNTSTCSSTVMVSDTISPTAVCQPITIYVGTNESILASDLDGGSTDNCGAVTFNASQTEFDCSDLGNVNVTLTVFDASGNLSQCTTVVTVLDTVSPGLAAPIGASFEYPAGFNTAAVGINTPQDVLLDPTLTGNSFAFDNCTTVTITYQDVLSAPTPGSCPIIRTVTRTWTATDGSGNAVSIDQVFTLTDTTAPMITCPVDLVTVNDPGVCGIDGASLSPVTATDNYDPSVVITNDAPATIPVGTTTVTWTATDACGNSSQCTQQVTVSDNENPTTPTLYDIVENCYATVFTQYALDNCAGYIAGTTSDPLFYSTQGTHVVNWTFDDGNGNSISVPQNVIIQNGTVTGTDVVEECEDFYTWIDGVTYIADNSSATHTLTSAAGCDSIVSLNLTFLTPATGTDVQTACVQYTWIDGNTYGSSNNTTTFTIVGAAANGCDSIVTLDLTIINGTSGIDTRTECDALVWLDGSTYTSSNNAATFVIANGAANGCDSLVTLDLTIVNSSSTIDFVDACDSYTWIDGITYTANNSTATHVIPNAAGCDSTITLDLIINTVDVSIANASPTLTANESGATYQWIDCDNGNAVIAGEIAQSFTAIANGNYAVIITNANCSDTSACEMVNNVGIDELKDAELVIYPNPTNTGLFTVKYTGTIEQITLFDLTGRAVQVSTNTSTGMVDASSLDSGKYFVQVQTNKGQSIKSIIITK